MFGATYFPVTADYSSFPDFTSNVTFRPVLDHADAVKLGTGQQPTQWFNGSLTPARIKNGLLKAPNGSTCLLVADLGLDLQGTLQYEAVYTEAVLGFRELVLTPYTFAAPSDTSTVQIPCELNSGAGVYILPEAGIPSTDLADDIQAALSLAQTAVQPGANVLQKSVVTVSSSTTIGGTAGTEYFVLIAAGGAPRLPTAVSNQALYHLKNTTGSPVAIATTSSQTIEGGSYSLAPGEAITVITYNGGWVII